jgi:DNA ligase (NAD+)
MSENCTDIEQRILELKRVLNVHSYKYHVEDNPDITDYEYDILYNELLGLEIQRPDLITIDSPTQRVGDQPISAFEKVTHEVQMLSLPNVFSENELIDFDKRVRQSLNNDVVYVVEKKIDGLSVSLEYVDGAFVRGSTRGDGIIGENVTQNIKTIKSIPMVLKDNISFLEVRGEVFMPRKYFDSLNKLQEEKGLQIFANPRNAAAGSLRQLNSKITSSRKLDIFVFNIQQIRGKNIETHSESLEYLKNQGFKVSSNFKLCADISQVMIEVNKIGAERGSLSFDTDGAVIKVNSLHDRDDLGVVGKYPKWACAFKYPAERKETKIINIEINVGRTGVLTPLAILEPVNISGSRVGRATLHNLDFIQSKDIRIGDTVVIQKAGEIIPEVVQSLIDKRTGCEKIFEMPDHCPVCGGKTYRAPGEAVYKCMSENCPAQLFRSIVHFASRNAMNIDGLGPAIIDILLEKQFIKDIADLYFLEDKKDELMNIDRMGKKSVENLLESIEKSKYNNIDRLIFGLGISQVGKKAAEILAEKFDSIYRISKASFEELKDLPDFGEITAQNVVDYFSKPWVEGQLNRIENASVNMRSIKTEKQNDGRFAGASFVLTGTLSGFSRTYAEKIIKSFGGKISGSVSSKTNYVLVGDDPGSKLAKAQELNIRILSEDEFSKLIEQ